MQIEHRKILKGASKYTRVNVPGGIDVFHNKWLMCMTENFYQRVKELIKAIPPGKVATYGQIAALAGNPRGARQVAWVLHTSSRKDNLPWHRVVNSKGRISLEPNYGYELQKALLEKEGVTFNSDDTIDFDRYLWRL